MISYKLSKTGIGALNVSRNLDQFTFGFPCQESQLDCSPYTVNLSPGSYRIESRGSVGTRQASDPNNLIVGGTPGLGGYTSGILNLNIKLTLYLFIGSNSRFNNVIKTAAGNPGGGASDVRLYVNSNFDWFDDKSLRSRIMVAGGGGGAEWNMSIGGNAGGLEGGTSISQCTSKGLCPGVNATGGTQTRGGISSTDNSWKHVDGAFGSVQIVINSTDMGGYGGNGYFSGGSLDWAGAGGDGSSFISGFDGCIALLDENSSTLSQNSSIHYSGYFFESPSMQRGNTSMPFYYNKNAHGIGNKGRGCIRITILNYLFTCHNNIYFNFRFLTHVFVLI